MRVWVKKVGDTWQTSTRNTITEFDTLGDAMAAAYAIQNRAANNAVVSQGGDGEGDNSGPSEGCPIPGVGEECPCRLPDPAEPSQEEPSQLVA